MESDRRPLRQRCTFVALSGGGSRRMGRDKAFVPVGGREMLHRLLEVGRAVSSDCVLVVDDPGPYAEAVRRYGWEAEGAGGGGAAPAGDALPPGAARRFRHGDARLRVITDRHPGLGPVAGLESGLGAAGGTLCFAAACDLPFLTAGVACALLGELEAHRREAADPDLCAVVPVAGGRRQPLAAAYARGAGRAAARCVEEGRLKMDDLLGGLDVRTVQAADLPREGSGDAGRPFVNVNDPGQLREARRRARDRDAAP